MVRYYFFQIINKEKPKSYFRGTKNVLNEIDQIFVNLLVGYLVLIPLVLGIVYLCFTLF